LLIRLPRLAAFLLSLERTATLEVADVDDLICAVLRGETRAWPTDSHFDLQELFIRRVEYHGVSGLLYECAPQLIAWPASICEGIRRHSLAQAFWELRHQQVLSDVVAALSRKGIEPIFFKGTALAYGLYEEPFWRSRGDSDFIVPPGDARRTGEVLQTLGFEREQGVSGKLNSNQESYTLTVQGGGKHSIDLHRRIYNSELLARLFSYEELRAEAHSLPELCSDALAVGPKHALLLACLHRLVHRHNPYYVDRVAYCGENRLIWLYDIHLLAQSFTPVQWHELERSATEKGLCATSLDGIDRAAMCFHTLCPDDVRQSFSKAGEPAALYLDASPLRQLWIDFLATEGVAERLRYAQKLVFPSAAYMRAKYARASPTWLPWLYARRAAAGIIERLSQDMQPR
jgi:hypothetical protein